MYDIFFFKQETAYEVRISDWSSDVCSSDLRARHLFFQSIAEYIERPLVLLDRELHMNTCRVRDRLLGRRVIRRHLCQTFRYSAQPRRLVRTMRVEQQRERNGDVVVVRLPLSFGQRIQRQEQRTVGKGGGSK